ncbi:MAG: glycosyltransferase [Patescibacteria group bacterium]|jgi:glycosyltransferase involved in cell wall biosynthesis
MKIIIINNLYYPYHKGGAEKVCETLIKNYQQQGHEVILITTKPKKSQRKTPHLKTYYINSEYFNLDKKTWFYRLFWHFSSFFQFKKSKQLKKIIENEKADLIVSNNLMGFGWLSFKTIRETGVKHHHILHDLQLLHPSGLMFFGQEKKLNSILAKLYQKLTRKLTQSPALIISPSAWLLNEHQKRNYFKNSHTKIQKNPYPIVNKKNLKPEASFVFVGQIAKHKGIIFLIETWKKLNNKNYTLKIIGQGPLLEKIKKISASESNIEILGQKNSNEVFLEIEKSLALIVPSYCYENSPTVIYEAQALDRPVIASNLGGIPEILRPNIDFSFQPLDKNDLIKKINLLTK